MQTLAPSRLLSECAQELEASIERAKGIRVSIRSLYNILSAEQKRLSQVKRLSPIASKVSRFVCKSLNVAITNKQKELFALEHKAFRHIENRLEKERQKHALEKIKQRKICQ